MLKLKHIKQNKKVEKKKEDKKCQSKKTNTQYLK